MKKITPALLLALAALALPAGATPLTQTQTTTAGFAQVQADLEIVVDKENGLSDAIDMADAEMKKGQIKEVTITINTCEPQKLPGGIRAAGKITIVGCGDVSAGVGGDKDAERTVLTPSSSSEGMLVQSPLEIRGVKLEGFPNQAFNVQDELTISNSVFIGRSSFLSRPRVASVDIPSAKPAQKVVFRDSYFEGAIVAQIKGGQGKVTISKNVVKHDAQSSQYTVEIFPSNQYPTAGANPILIEDNQFSSTGAQGGSNVIRIGRPDVTVHNNTFTLENPDKTAYGVNLYNPRKSDGPVLKNVSVTYNVFNGGLGVGNTLDRDTPLTPDAVKVNHNDFSKTTGAFPKGSTYGYPNTATPDGIIDATLNFWGTIDTTTVQAKTDPVLGKFEPFVPPVPPQPQPPVPPVVPGPQPRPSASPSPSPSVSPSPAGPRVVARVSGETRVETAVRVAESEYKDGAKVVILARSDVAADSVSAVPLAEELDAPILLTQSDSLHPATGAALKKLLPSGGRVILMGGEVALSAKVANDVTGLGGSVERIAGLNRAGTAVETANQLMKADKLKQLLVADGTDWQADLIAGPAAAEADGATLLTNGDVMAPETAAFLSAHANVKVTAIGANAVKASGVASKVEGADATALSLAVAKQFFRAPKAVGVATDAEFADSLAGGAQVAKHDGPMVLVPASIPGTVPAYLKATPSVTNVYVYGGPTRIPEDQLAGLAE
ncbi:cell wall-binding repeat-containing protein [Stomatohabitans albus]|uniref:cell wall-binding repeat-containing protein n=1 Tax=Stomatohabitans albus TaxID=3110766 RepID=UPI00300D90C1